VRFGWASAWLAVDGGGATALGGALAGVVVQRYQHVIDELRIEASNRLGALLWGDDDKPKKPKKKRRKEQQADQAKQKPVDIDTDRFATDHATTGQLAQVIPLRRLA
jgi:hypothetical protein